MLIKKKLLQIPPQHCPKIKNQKKKYSFKEYYQAAAQITEDILVIDIYKNEKIVKRWFSDGANWQWHVEDKDSWSNTIGCDVYGAFCEVYESNVTDKEKDKICDFLGVGRYCQGELHQMMYNFMSSRNAEKRNKYLRKKYSKIYEIVAESVYVPRKLNDWSLRNLFPPISMFWPREKNKKYMIRCLSCDSVFETDKVRHKGEWKCPHCHRTTQTIAVKYIANVCDKARIAIPKKIKGGFAIADGWLRRRLDEHGNQRIQFDNFQIYHQKNEITTLHKSQCSYSGYNYARYQLSGDTQLYTADIKKVFPGGIYDGINLQNLKGKKIEVMRIFDCKTDFDTVRKICNAQLYGFLGYESLLMDAKTFTDATGIDPNYVTAFRENCYDLRTANAIETFHECFNKKGTYNPEQLKTIDWMKYEADRVYNLAEYMTDTKLINYFDRQRKLYSKYGFGTILTWYFDYIRCIEYLSKDNKINIDITKTIVRFPKDIKKAHDRMEKEIQAAKDEKANIDLKKHAETYKKIPVPKGKLTVRFPESRADMVAEGNKLRHCVGWNPIYYERQASGEYMTFFIRKKEDPDKPYFTATFYLHPEIGYKESYGLSHKNPTKEVMEFINQYMENVKKALNEERKVSAA